MQSELEYQELTTEEKEKAFIKFHRKVSLSSKEVKYLFSLIGFKESTLAFFLGTYCPVLVYNRFKNKIQKDFKPLIEENRLDSLEKHMMAELRSNSGIRILKYAAYLRALGRRLVFTDYSKNGEYVFLDVTKTNCEGEDNDSETDLVELMIQTGITYKGMTFRKKWSPLGLEMLKNKGLIRGNPEKDIFNKFQVEEQFLANYQKEVGDKKVYRGFLFLNLDRIRFRLKKREVGSDKLLEGEASLATESHYDLINETKLISSANRKLHSDKEWSHSEIEMLSQKLSGDKHWLKYKYLVDLRKQKADQIRSEFSFGSRIDIDSVEKYFVELLKSRAMPLYELGAYLFVKGRILALANSEKLDYVFYQIPLKKEYVERSVDIPFLLLDNDSPYDYYRAARRVNGWDYAPREKITRPIFLAGRSFVLAFKALKAHGIKSDKAMRELAPRCMFRSFPKKNGDGFYHRFYLKKQR